MEKLKAKHDHKLTDIVKVCMFSLFLLLPLLMFIPSCIYYGVNEHATAPTTTEENIELVNFNQLYNYQNGTTNEITTTFNNGLLSVEYNNNYDTVVYTTVSYYVNYIEGNTYYFYYRPVNALENFDVSLQIYLNNPDDSYPYLNSANKYRYIVSRTNEPRPIGLQIPASSSGSFSCYVQLFDLTQMFGAGNEPTNQEFDSMFPENYYKYTESEYKYIKNGTTTEYIDISKNIYLAWQSLWQKPILQWTGLNNFSFTINAVTNVFGILQESYIANYLCYIMTLLVIYIIYDIVIVLFTKLTHIFNE